MVLAETQRGGHAGAQKHRSRAGLQDGGKHRRRGIGLRVRMLIILIINTHEKWRQVGLI